jgi:DNA-binding NtrC family response regulator
MPIELTVPINRPLAALRVHKTRIEVVDGPDQGLVADLPGPHSRIGTGKECELVLKDPTVSRVHVMVRIEGDSIRIVDVGSRNGTRIDGIAIRDAYARADSLITLGNTRLRLRMLDDVVDFPLSLRERFGRLLGKSTAMRHAFAILERIAPTDMPVLIEGENGTGKELVAEAIHEHSSRSAEPYVIFDCSAISPGLIESELFGHMRGAFTSAVSDRVGVFEAASGGTLFLDEIGELPLDLQPKLLRALERGEVQRVGSNVKRRVDVRVIAATNRQLAREVERGKFREDLYFRLNVLNVSLPPLRERLDDIPIIARHFEKDLMPRTGATAPLSDETINAFMNRSWPGNVRQLRNEVARALSLGVSPHVPPSAALPTATGEAAPPAIDLSEPLLVGSKRIAEVYEKAYIEAALRETGGNVSRTAETAQVNRKYIQRAMKRWGLREDEPE